MGYVRIDTSSDLASLRHLSEIFNVCTLVLYQNRPWDISIQAYVINPQSVPQSSSPRFTVACGVIVDDGKPVTGSINYHSQSGFRLGIKKLVADAINRASQ